MSVTSPSPAADALSTDLSRRTVCAALGLGALLGQHAPAASHGGDWLLTDQYGLMRRAYQTNDAELLRQVYSPDVVLATEGSSAVVGLDAVIAMGHQVLAKRRDIEAEVLRVTRSPSGDASLHVTRLTAYPRDPAEAARVATAFLYWQRSPSGWRCHTEVILMQDLAAVAGLRHASRSS